MSRDGYAGNDDTVNLNFYQFLRAFLSLHSRYVSNVNGVETSRPIFITGESHAGHYIPSMTSHIMKRNADPNFKNLQINVAGLALGNPWIDPKVCVLVYFVYNSNPVSFFSSLILDGSSDIFLFLEPVRRVRICAWSRPHIPRPKEQTKRA